MSAEPAMIGEAPEVPPKDVVYVFVALPVQPSPVVSMLSPQP